MLVKKLYFALISRERGRKFFVPLLASAFEGNFFLFSCLFSTLKIIHLTKMTWMLESAMKLSNRCGTFFSKSLFVMQKHHQKNCHFDATWEPKKVYVIYRKMKALFCCIGLQKIIWRRKIIYCVRIFSGILFSCTGANFRLFQLTSSRNNFL